METVNINITEQVERVTITVIENQVTGGGGTTIHNELNERDADDAHPISAITGLAGELAGKQPAGNYAAAVHGHVIGDVTGLQSILQQLAPEIVIGSIDYEWNESATECVITVTASGGLEPLQYRINGGAWQGSNQFTVTDEDTYTIDVQDFVGNILSDTVTNTIDPIAILTNSYISYVEADGGVTASYQDIYDEYSDMIDKGEILESGLNMRKIRNFGTWGYKLNGTVITKFYSLVKLAGNDVYPEYPAILNNAFIQNGKVVFANNTVGNNSKYNVDFDFEFDSFFHLLKGEMQQHSTSATTIMTRDSDQRGASLAMVDNTNQRARHFVRMLDNTSIEIYPAVSPPFFLGSSVTAEYLFKFERDLNNLTVRYIRDGSQRAIWTGQWDNLATWETEFGSSITGATIRLINAKFGLMQNDLNAEYLQFLESEI
jgi:hypothetical protein